MLSPSIKAHKGSSTNISQKSQRFIIIYIFLKRHRECKYRFNIGQQQCDCTKSEFNIRLHLQIANCQESYRSLLKLVLMSRVLPFSSSNKTESVWSFSQQAPFPISQKTSHTFGRGRREAERKEARLLSPNVWRRPREQKDNQGRQTSVQCKKRHARD